MKKILLVILFVGALSRFAHVATDGFILNHIYAPLTPGKEITLEKKIIDQPYSYLASGSQSYVFISRDKAYILKFFREHRWRTRNFKKGNKKQEGRRATYASATEAFTHLKQETGMLALHLNQTSTLGKVTIYDRNHIAHEVDLNNVAFAIQKNAVNFGTYLKTAPDEDGKAAINSMLRLMNSRFALGLRDKDPHPINNFGVINGNVIDIDIGGFARDPSKGKYYFYHEELETVKKKLIPWLKRHAPHLEKHANNSISQLQNRH